MSDPRIDPRALNAPAQAPPTPTRGASSPPPTGSASFQVLLEQLQARAGELGRQVERVADPGELAQAVDRAESSLHEALALKEQLLEAYRQALQASAGDHGPAGDR